MKQLNGGEPEDRSRKQTGRTKKHKPSSKLFSKTCWPKVMISRDSIVCRKSNGPSGSSASVSYLEESANELSTKEEDLYCKENNVNFEEDQGVCLISSSSEIPCESLQKLNGSDSFVCEDATSETSGCREKPIFVDLTADEKNTWKQTILKRFDELETAGNENDHENCSVNVALEPRIMIADSSSKSNCNGGGSLATALRDRGPYSIPVQPNRSLPIRPAPCVPARYLRKDCSPSLVLPKSSTMDVVEVEPTKSVDKEAVRKNLDVDEERSSSVDYAGPRISSVESLNGTKRKTNEEKNGSKENRRRKRSQEADSTQREERAENSIKEFLKNFCGSNANDGAQNSCTEKCSIIVSSSKEEGNKVVPPLRLKKVFRTETKGYTFKTCIESEHESNYRIVTGTTPRPSSSPVPSTWNVTLGEKDTNFSPTNTDSYKLEYRRNKLKQKLHELRGKAQELAQQMASDCTSQQSTSMRQVMNRYEKQIENLSKLHGKLSADIPVSNKVVDVNDDFTDLSDDEYLLMSFGEKQTTSPEPPKLSPRSSTNYDNMLPEKVRNSPPILSRMVITSSEDPVDEKLQIMEEDVWSTNEESIKKPLPVDPSQDVDKVSSDFEECVRTNTLKQQGDMSIDAEDFGERSSKVPRNSPTIQESEKVKCLEMMSLVPDNVEMAAGVQDGEVLESKLAKRLHLSGNHLLQSTSSESAPADVSFYKINESAGIAPKVASSLNQWNELNVAGAKLNHENLENGSQQNYKEEDTTTGDNDLVTEQFPTLGNWLTRISKKQVSKSKSKLQSAGNIPFAAADSSNRISGVEIHKVAGPNTATDSTNATPPQYSTERWQYHNQQQQRQQRQQQLLQHVAASVTLSQPAPAIPPLRPALYPPIPMTQFYSNNYGIDPYNTAAALSYHSPICPYGSYPYHSRIHSGSLPGYHFPMQESLRPLQHLEKRFSPMQDTMVRYPYPSTSLQHPTNIDFDRIRGSSNVGNNVATCLPSLFVSPPSLSSSHQTLPRTPLTGYPSNSQLTRNKMIPDVVAAAAAAAVVAAASIDRQRDTLSYNRNHSNPLTAPGIIGGHAAHSAKTMIGQDAVNCTRNGNFVEETRDNRSKYQPMQNFLYDRLTLVKSADNFARTKLIDNDRSATTSVVSAPYRVPLTSTDSQLSKSVVKNELRNCETPHLGKVSRSPSSLYNLVCSNCNSIAPKFKCLGCEMAFYCDERCQEKHWYVHVQRCPKKMPKLKKVT